MINRFNLKIKIKISLFGKFFYWIYILRKNSKLDPLLTNVSPLLMWYWFIYYLLIDYYEF